MQDVLAALVRKGLDFGGYFNPSRPALLDADHAVRVNYETYVFTDVTSRALFMSDPTRYCGLITDPVSKRRFRPHDDSPRAEHDGVAYYFEDDSALSISFALPSITGADPLRPSLVAA